MSFPELKGKVAIVTGAGAGIGRATALALAREGVNVVVADWHSDDGLATVAEVARLTGSDVATGQALFVQTDVSQSASCQNLVSRTITRFGRLDILHNNAGIQTYGTVSVFDGRGHLGQNYRG